MIDRVTAVLASRGLSLPEPPPPGGSYDAARIVGSVAYVAVQFPIADGAFAFRGRLGRELTTEHGLAAAELCALNVLAQIDRFVGFDRVLGLTRVDAVMLTVEGWDEMPKVLDGASRLFLDALGEAGRHARTLCGVDRLPGDAPIALTTSFTLRA